MGAMLRANQAVRLGLRAASRNPELAFGKALFDQVGSLLALLPALLGILLFASALGRGGLSGVAAALGLAARLRWPLAGALLAVLVLLVAAGSLFWAGALPILAADAEMDRRPPAGNFGLLAARGFARVLRTGLLGGALSLAFTAAGWAAVLFCVPAALLHPSPAMFAGAAAVAAMFVVGSVLLELLFRLMLVRSAALGDGATAAFGRAASLLAGRLGACVAVTVAFLFLELIAGAVAGTLGGVISSTSLLDLDAQALALWPRLALGLAAAAVFSWLDVGRQGALAAIAADAEGLIEHVPLPGPAPRTLERPAAQGPVVEALPVEDDD